MSTTGSRPSILPAVRPVKTLLRGLVYPRFHRSEAIRCAMRRPFDGRGRPCLRGYGTVTDSTRNGARTHRVSARVRRRRRLVAFVSAAVLVTALVTTVAVVAATRGGPDAVADVSASAPTTTTSPTATPTPLTAAQELLETTDDPNACAVSFEGDGVADEPMLQTQGVLYTGLPIPQREGLVFAGWYATPEDAAVFDDPGRDQRSRAGRRAPISRSRCTARGRRPTRTSPRTRGSRS